LKIAGVDVTQRSGSARLSATMEWERVERPPERIEFTYHGIDEGALSAPGDALVVALLFFATSAGEDMRIDVPVSRRLLSGTPAVVELNRRWHPRWHPTRVQAQAVDRPRGPGLEVGAFFSGGVDSFATILRARPDPVTVLLSVLGLDIRFEQRAAGDQIVSHLAQAARELEMKHVVADTNVFEIGHRYFPRSEHFGSTLSAIALGLGGMLRCCYLPTASALEPRPWGAQVIGHPEWATESLELCNDGGEESRYDKLRRVIESDVALRYLRVCIREPASYNCGRCDKCVGTAVALTELGAIDRCATLARVEPRAVARTRLSLSWLSEFQDLREWMTDPELKHAVGLAIKRNRIMNAARPAVDAIRRRRARRRLRAWESRRVVAGPRDA